MKVKRQEKDGATFSPSAISWQKEEPYFSRDPDGAHKEWFSRNTFAFYTVSGRNNPTLICLLTVSTSFPLFIMDEWDWNTGKIMVVWRGRRQWKQGTFHSQPALQEQTAIWDLSTHTLCKCTRKFLWYLIFTNSFSLKKCTKDLSVLQIYLPASGKDLFLTHCSTFHLHWLSVHLTMDT